MGNLDKWELKHVKDIARYEKAIQRIYTTYTQEAAKIGASISGFDPTKPLSFADYPLTNKLIKDLQRRMAKDIKAVVVNGVDEQWALSDDKAGELVEKLFADLTDAQREAYIRRYLTTRERAREAFKMRKDAGLGLSDRVWQYTDQYKEEIEMAIDLGLREGESAAQMTLSLRKYLNNPDMLFRRVRDEHGMLHLSKRAKAYHPGQGVYRSSYKNARRLAATETNMAYRSADYQRNQSLDFVVGIRIKLSNNHTLNGEPFTDICDWLSAPNGSNAISGRGCYPKDFKFTGWHPLCRCFIQTIHKTREEIAEDARRIRQGLSPLPPSTSKNYVGDVPDEFKAWCKLNAARVERAKSLPYFIRDNRDYYDDALNPRKKTLTPLEVAKHRHEQRTPEQIESIKNRWAKSRLNAQYSKNMPNALKVGEKYLLGEDYVFDRRFFDLLDNNRIVKLEILDSDSGSYEVGGWYVRLASKNRNQQSPWHKKSVVYHEYGHCIDDQRGLKDDDALKKMRNKQKKWLKEQVTWHSYVKRWDTTTKSIYYGRTEIVSSRIEQIEYRLKELSRKVYRMNDEVFTSRGITKYDVIEQILAARDTIMSLDPNYGAGHSKSYFSRKGFKEAEYLAHAFENAFLGNPVFKKYMPDIYQEMVEFINNLKPLS